MNLGTSDKSSKLQPRIKTTDIDFFAEPESVSTIQINDVVETVSVFTQKIAAAQAGGKKFIETTPEIIKFYQPNGTGNNKYFYFSGIRVYPYGCREQIEADEAVQLGRKLHGEGEGIVEGTHG